MMFLSVVLPVVAGNRGRPAMLNFRNIISALRNTPSGHVHSAVHREGFPGDIATGGRSQKHHGGRDVLILRHIARHDERVRAERAGEFFDVFLESFALVGEGEHGAGLVPGLRDGPRDGAFVGDAEDESDFACE